MSSWRAAEAKAKFSKMLDQAENAGPQLVRRRKQVFVITTEAEIERRLAQAKAGKRKKFISAWEALGAPGNVLDEKEFEEFSTALREIRGH